MKLIKRFNPWLILVIFIGIFLAWPLFRLGFLPTHDGEYHLIRFWQFGKMLAAGYLFPRWAPDLNFGYGVPLFNFQYPLPNYFGVILLTLGFSLADSFKLVLAFGYLSAGVLAFLWLKKIFNDRLAATGAILGLSVPYFLLDIYVRGSVGEVWAIAFLFLGLFAVEREVGWLFSLAIAGLILSHNILGLLFCGLILLYLLIFRRPQILFWFLGIGIAAYFWLPALLERQYVVGLNPVDFRDYFVSLDQLLIPSWGTGLAGESVTSNSMSTQIGIIPLILLLLACLVRFKLTSLFWLIIALIGITLTLKISLPIWNIFSFLSYLQYPWRFLSLLIPAICYLGAFLLFKLKNAGFTIVLLITNLILIYPYSRPSIYLPRSDEYYLSKPQFTDGTNSIGNAFTTVWDKGIKQRSPQSFQITEGEARIKLERTNILEYQLAVESKGARMSLPILYYPGWEVKLGQLVLPIDYAKDGLLNFPLPAGNYQLNVEFRETIPRKLADFVSLGCLFLLAGLAILKQTRYADRHRYYANPGSESSKRSRSLR